MLAIFWTLLTIILLVLILYYSSLLKFDIAEKDADTTILKSLIYTSSQIPFISQDNASFAINFKLVTLQNEFETVLNDQKIKWNTMRQSDNITIERAETSYGGPDYLKTTAQFGVPPQKLIQLFSWDKFHLTQTTIDPFFESCSLLMNISTHCRVILKTTKRPLMFPKRRFFMSMMESFQQSPFMINLHNSWHGYANNIEKECKMDSVELCSSKNPTVATTNVLKNVKDTTSSITIPVPKRTIISSLMSVNIATNNNELKSDTNYVHAFQDFIAWFIDDGKGGTLLVILMRVDLGSDIPKWAFLTTVAATGVWSMRALIKLSKEFTYSDTSIFTDESSAKHQQKPKHWENLLMKTFPFIKL
mmetsp:Transcript_29866/g.42600  ORF Transcript_29866/g.42600 Transcript_29866/m.42600 type:complete len:361 (-) Transcript_29866:180-1262(-)